MDNKQIIELIRKPAIMPKNILHEQSFKQAINFYHRQMIKRLNKTAK